MTGQGRIGGTLTDSIVTCFQKYIDFSGRASRSEFWWFFLFAVVAQAILGVFLPGIAFLALTLPFLAVSARRLHDTGRSAWWLTLYLAAGLGSAAFAVAAFVAAFAGDFQFQDFDFETGEVAAFVLLLLLGIATAVICGLLPLVLCAFPGAVGPNLYGPDPLRPQPQVKSPDAPPPDPEPGGAGDEPEAERPRFCAQCGTGLPADAMFCANCGAAI